MLSGSVEPFESKLEGPSAATLTASVIQVAVVAGTARAGSSDWVAPVSYTPGPKTGIVRYLLGPLAAGTWSVYVRFTDGPASPEQLSGRIVVQ